MEGGERSDFPAAAENPSTRTPYLSDSAQSAATSSLVGNSSPPPSIFMSLQESCAIFLGSMKPEEGHALFTAECSHDFHFRCIASNVEHGNQVFPICRSMWKEMPSMNSASDFFLERPMVNSLDWPSDEHWMILLHESVHCLLRF